MQIDLSNRLAIITGATGDLGRVMVHTLSDAGADIVVHYSSNKAKADELVAAVQAKGRQAVAVQCDVCDTAAIEAMGQEVRESIGDPNIIVSNAVVQYQPWSPVLEQSYADYESQHKSCVMQNVAMAKTFVPAMIETGWGRVIALNTECSLESNPGQSAYTSGKHGMNAVLRCLAREVGQHEITVNQVAPGWMISDRDRQAEAANSEATAYAESLPMRRRGEDQDIANVVAFLASDLAGYISGAFIPVCGAHVLVGV